MAETIGQHGLAAFVNPSNGDALDATVVKGNDNTIRTAYVAHDDDGGIHVQSSLLASRPAAGTTGRKWLTTDTGSVKLWYDNGSTWQEASYIQSSGDVTISANFTVTGNTTLGDATSDLVTFVSRVASSITPQTTNASDLGTSALRWKDIYLSGNAYITGSASFGGNAVVTGSVSAASFSGTVDASNISSGTLPDARFPATLPAVSGANLTSLNASNISSGTINNSRLPTTISGTLAVFPTLSGASASPRNTIKLGDSDTVFLTATAASTLVAGNTGSGSLTGLTGFAGPTGTTFNVTDVRYIQTSVAGSTRWYIPIFYF